MSVEIDTILPILDSFHQQEGHPGLITSSKWFYLGIVSPKSRNKHINVFPYYVSSPACHPLPVCCTRKGLVKCLYKSHPFLQNLEEHTLLYV